MSDSIIIVIIIIIDSILKHIEIDSRETEHFNVRKYIVVGGGVSDSIIIIIDIILKYIEREREKR